MTISPDSAKRRHDIDDAADDLVLENNDEEEFYNMASGARGQRSARGRRSRTIQHSVTRAVARNVIKMMM